MSDFLNYILSPQAVRETTKKVYDLTLANEGLFQFHPEKLDEVCSFVLEVIQENYPDLNIPYHSRWGHFKVGPSERLKLFYNQIHKDDALEQARKSIDLVVTSVLLDAGAGPSWKFLEPKTQQTFSRSEGLAVASYYMFMNGDFSSHNQLQADGEKLKKLSVQNISVGFQVKENNPLVGLSGRTQLLQKLGALLCTKPEFFKDQRPGNLVDYLMETHGTTLEASDILKAVLLGFGEIWPGRIDHDGYNLGDVWSLPKLQSHSKLGEGQQNTYVAFHKLSQWLTYSLIEPLREGGFTVNNVDQLTGLAEYRNGGLMVDTGLISLKDPELLKQTHSPNSELIIEWRALTVQLLDQIASKVRHSLNKNSEDFPLAKVLEGGTWWAGRKIAKSIRPDGTPPIRLNSDGTVF